ncbi:MAG: SPOR domain-containing protein [Cryomorphaceae bacterium]|nr:SPOR domain-containing protein [Cryomorphaceae bacterium]
MISLILFFLSHSIANAQDENVIYNDTLTKKLFQIKKDYSKRIFESTYYTIQIYFGDLKNADSILIDFQENYEGIKSELIFETPNYKVRIGEYKDINIASQKLEGIRRTYPGSFIIKLSEL